MAKTKKKSDRVVVSILLKKDARDPESIHRLQRNAAKLGLQPTTQGRATACFQTTPEHFQKLFGIEAKAVAERKPTDSDKGTPAGFEVEVAIPIPAALKAETQSISVQPPATRFTEQFGAFDLSQPTLGSTHHGKAKEYEQEEDDQEEDREENDS